MAAVLISTAAMETLYPTTGAGGGIEAEPRKILIADQYMHAQDTSEVYYYNGFYYSNRTGRESFVCLFDCLFVFTLFVRSFIHSFVRLFLHSLFVCFLVRLLVCSFVGLLVRLLVNALF